MTKTIRNIFWVALLALPVFLQAQETLSEKDQRKFDYYFFEGERLKQIERYNGAINAFLQCAKLDEENAAIAFELGKLFAKINNAEEALFYLKRAYELAPENKWIAADLADLHIALDQLPEATVIYSHLAEKYPSNVGYRFELAQLYFNQKKLPKCIQVLNEIELLTGVNEELSQQKKEIYLLMDDVDGAEKELEKLVKAYPKNIDYKGSLAQFYAANEEQKKAIALYDEMLEESPDDPRAHLDLANIYKQQKEYQKSYEHLKIALGNPNLNVDLKVQVLYSFFTITERDTSLKKMAYDLLNICVEANPNEPKMFAMLGDYQLRDSQFKAARKSYRKATRLGANQLQIWSQLLLLDARINNNDTLVADGEEFISIYPNQPLGYLMAGSGYLQLEKYNQAASTLEAGLDFVLDNVELEEQFYISLADAYHRLNQHDKSDAYFDKALAINPNDPGVLNNYAYYLSERGVRLQDALEMTEKSNTLAPKNAVFLDTWAWVLFKLGKYNLALEKIEACAAHGGANSGEVIEHWGDILFKLNRKTEALEKWKLAATKADASKNIQRKIETQQLYE